MNRRCESLRESARRVGAPAVAAVVMLGGCNAADAPPPAESESGAGAGSPAPAMAVPRVEIVEPADGTEVTGPIVRIGLTVDGIELAPAGDERPGTGHHHLFVNEAPTPAGEPIPANVPRVVHLGKAQTFHELTDLAPGEYTVIAVLGDLIHRRIDPQVLDTVRFRVR